MRRNSIYAVPLFALTAWVSGCTTTQMNPAGEHSAESHAAGTPAAGAMVVSNPSLPAGEADAMARLNSSPRHGEWAMVSTGPGD
ncbi:MAG: hypothetical protein M3466_09615, partial [Gemmatimonadota bacterium]|nr:hypothetical protein [Gemmatimonadota bacterium]